MGSEWKARMKRAMQSVPRLDTESIIRRIRLYKSVSFDVFDTAIKRDVPHPRDVFTLVGQRYSEQNGAELDNFPQMRIEAEYAARRALDKPEITLMDIYTHLPAEWSAKQRNTLMQLECEMELSLCGVNQALWPVYRWCVENGKMVLFISDMYLPQELISAMLAKSGYAVHPLFVSGSIGLKKRSGRLFTHVLDTLELTRSELIHIGDSYKSDIVGSRKAGVRALYIAKIQHNLHPTGHLSPHAPDRFAYDCLRTLQNNRLPHESTAYVRWGYEVFGPLLLGFCRWMHDDLLKRGINKIVFFSRDGYILKRAFESLYDGWDTSYLYVSRRSLRIPQLWLNPDIHYVVRSFPLARRLTMESYLKNVGLEPALYWKTLEDFSLNLNSIIKREDIAKDPQLLALYQKLLPDIIQNSKMEYERLITYLNQSGIQGDIAVVDIGWHGSLQYFLDKIIRQSSLSISLHGYYIGLSSNAYTGLDSKGFISDSPNGEGPCDSWKAFNGFIESLFLAQEGSTKAYTEEDGMIRPVLFDYEYENEGTLEWEAQKVNELQEGALLLIHQMKDSPLNACRISPFFSYTAIQKTGESPTKQDLNLFAAFRYLENKIDYLAKPQSFFYYLYHPKQLKEDLYFSRWKIGFLKKLLKLPLTYRWIYKMLKNVSG
jgi:predicted HAD superfamily hydrolase